MKRLVTAFLDNPDNARSSVFAPELRSTLRTRGTYYLRVLAISSMMIWGAMSVFLGAVYKRSSYLHDIHLDLVNLDNGPVGRMMTQHVLAGNTAGRRTEPQWRMRTDLRTLDEARRWTRQHGWGAIVISSGASERLMQQAVASGNSSSAYDPFSAATVVVSTGRHPIVSLSYTLPALSAAARGAALAFNTAYLQQLKQQIDEEPWTNGQPTAVYFRTIDVAPMTFNIAPIQPLFAFLVSTLSTVAALISWKMTTFGFFLKVKHKHIWMALLSLIAMWTLYISMNCALAVSFFRGPQYSQNALPYTVGRFFAIWGTTLAVLMAVALWLLSWYLVVTPEFIGLVSLITVLSNVVSTLVPAQVANRFYRVFYALPFYNGAILYRYIQSGAYPRLGQGVGVLLGEAAAMTVVLGLASWVRQVCVVRGISDVAGWYRGNEFFRSPVPLQKRQHGEHLRWVRRHGKQQDQISVVSIADSAEDSTSLREGNLGV
ncbi:hypothetical protein LPJ56_000589 [Coemansia sp. RSA 2599]|nr:hypothetical protein LPJ75_000272 [Coemansia sp. RSA 2598]KAJ1829163.1 hypothetical protein LPJ56_000589 [Coemansia sp. RSA 2599]